jgi:poly-gamma-glutamate synthesis protein (capsule biosynthesis protein)
MAVTNSITFLGDVFLPRPFQIGAVLGSRFVFNLEHPITGATAGWPGKINLKAEANHMARTFEPLPAAVCMANNHVMDYGVPGLEDTFRELRRAGIPWFGAGTFDESAGNPLLLQGAEIALLGYACPTTAAVFAEADRPGAARLEFSRVVADMEAARRSGATRVIVSLHWGEEHVFLPKPTDVRLARQIIDAGADLVIGHHAHCFQPFERYRGKYIFYGLGNTITPDIDQPSFFDEAGAPRGRAFRKQHWWNKQSLAVDYDVSSGDVRVRELHFDGRALREVRSRTGRYELPLGTDEAYAERYRRSFTYGKLRNKVMTYVKTPRLPRLRHLRSIVNIAREATTPRY